MLSRPRGRVEGRGGDTQRCPQEVAVSRSSDGYTTVEIVRTAMARGVPTAAVLALLAVLVHTTTAVCVRTLVDSDNEEVRATMRPSPRAFIIVASQLSVPGRTCLLGFPVFVHTCIGRGRLTEWSTRVPGRRRGRLGR